MIDGNRPAAMDLKNTRSVPVVGFCYGTEENVLGRMRSARGASRSAWTFLPCSNNDSDELMTFTSRPGWRHEAILIQTSGFGVGLRSGVVWSGVFVATFPPSS